MLHKVQQLISLPKEYRGNISNNLNTISEEENHSKDKENYDRSQVLSAVS